MLALATASAIFLRWLSHHGFPVLLLFAVSAGAAGTIHFTRRQRYRTSSRGIKLETADANTSAVLWTAFAGLTLGGLGTAVVLAG